MKKRQETVSGYGDSYTKTTIEEVTYHDVTGSYCPHSISSKDEETQIRFKTNPRLNTSFMDALRNLADVTNDVTMAEPTKDELVASFVGVGDAVNIPDGTDSGRIIRQISQGRSVPAVSSTDAFYGGFNYITDTLKDHGIQNPIQAHDSLLPYKRTGEERFFFLPNSPSAIRYAATSCLMAERLYSDEGRLQFALAIDGDELEPWPYLDLVRVMNRNPNRETAKQATIATIAEGVDSIAQAAVHLELGGADMANMSSEQQVQAVVNYTSALPRGGIVGPLAQHGDYFADLSNPDGTIKDNYLAAFKACKDDFRKDGDPTVMYADVDYSYISYYSDVTREQYLSLNDLGRKDINSRGAPDIHIGSPWQSPYQGLGCPALGRKILRDIATSFFKLSRAL